MTDERRHDHTDSKEQGDGTLGPGTTAGGGAVRAGERVDDDAAGERDSSSPSDAGAERD
jgi:hypothetical protein